MISNIFIKLAYILLSTILNLLPVSSGFSADVTSAATHFGSYFGMFSPIIPIGTLGIAVSVAFSVEIAIFGWKTLKSIVSHIPQFGGAGH